MSTHAPSNIPSPPHTHTYTQTHTYTAHSSKFFAGMLTACDTTRLHVEESRDCMEPVLAAMRGSPPAATYDTRSTGCWAVYKKVRASGAAVEGCRGRRGYAHIQ